MQAAAVDLFENFGVRLPVIGENPKLVIAARRSPGGLPDSLDRTVDPPERPMGIVRARSATMGLLVVAEEVAVYDRQAARNVHLHADRDQVAQKNSHRHARNNRPKLRANVAPAKDPVNRIGKTDQYFQKAKHRSTEQWRNVDQRKKQNRAEPSVVH